MKIAYENEVNECFLSYEGVYEACPIYGAKDHTINLCPAKPTPCLKLVVGKLEVSNLKPKSTTGGDWTTILPRMRGKPKVMPRPPKPENHFAPYPAPPSKPKDLYVEASKSHFPSPSHMGIDTSNVFPPLLMSMLRQVRESLSTLLMLLVLLLLMRI